MMYREGNYNFCKKHLYNIQTIHTNRRNKWGNRIIVESENQNEAI